MTSRKDKVLCLEIAPVCDRHDGRPTTHPGGAETFTEENDACVYVFARLFCMKRPCKPSSSHDDSGLRLHWFRDALDQITRRDVLGSGDAAAAWKIRVVRPPYFTISESDWHTIYAPYLQKWHQCVCLV